MATLFYQGTAGQTTMIADATESESHAATAVVTKHTVDKGADVADHVRNENDTLSLVLWFSNHPTRSTGDDFYEGAALAARSVSLEVATRVRRQPGNPILVAEGQRGGYVRDVPFVTQIANATGTLAGTAINLAGNIRVPPRAPEFQARPVESYEKAEGATVQQWTVAFQRARRVYEELLRLKANATLISVSTGLRDYDNMVIVGVNPTRDAATGNVLKVTLDLERVRIVGAVTVEITQPLQTRGFKQKTKGAQAKKEPTEAQEAKRKSALAKLASAYAPDIAASLGLSK